MRKKNRRDIVQNSMGETTYISIFVLIAQVKMSAVTSDGFHQRMKSK